MMASYGDEGTELSTPTVLKRDTPWETYLTARLISDRDLQLIRRYDKRNAETQQDLLTEVRPCSLAQGAQPVRSGPARRPCPEHDAVETVRCDIAPVRLTGLLSLQAGPAYAQTFLTVLRNVTKEDTVQYVLALLDDLLQGVHAQVLLHARWVRVHSLDSQ